MLKHMLKRWRKREMGCHKRLALRLYKMKRKVIGVVLVSVLILLAVLSVINYRLATYVKTNLSVYTTSSQAQAALQKNGNDVEALRTLAQDDFQKRDYDASVTEWEKVMKLQPDNRSAKSYLAAALIQSGQKQEAITVLTDLSKQNDAYGRNAAYTLKKVLSKNPPGRIRPSV
jgi:predicted Zn-dependent protease